MSAYNHYQMSVHAKIDPIFHAWYTYIKKIYKKKIKVKIAIEKFWCVKYYKAQPYNMEHTLCVCNYSFECQTDRVAKLLISALGGGGISSQYSLFDSVSFAVN